MIDIEQLKTRTILKPLNSIDQLDNWFQTFFNISFPSGHVHEDSNSSPLEAAWYIYNSLKTGETAQIPKIALLSARGGYKTLMASAMEVLLMVHFRIKVAHMAAITSQSEKAVEYMGGFFRKIAPYLEANGWKKISDNKMTIAWTTDKKEAIYIKIIVATIAGCNSEHVPLLFIDEVDVIQDPRALEEAAYIPSPYKQYSPLTVFLSTRKFAGGLMEKSLNLIKQTNGTILRWNIIDITRRVEDNEIDKTKPLVERYVSNELPMSNLSPAQYDNLSFTEKNKYSQIFTHEEMATSPMLSVTKNCLVGSGQKNSPLHYTFTAVSNMFAANSNPEKSDAQLLCNKPESGNLVYRRFNSQNIISVQSLITKVTGENAPDGIELPDLVKILTNAGAIWFAGGDWGFADLTSLTVFAWFKATNDVYIIRNIAEKGLELTDIQTHVEQLHEMFPISQWWVDQAYPAYIKTLRKILNKYNAVMPKFTKKVEDGISATQSMICSSSGKRSLFVLDTPENQPVINAFGDYKWKTDAQGNFTNVPHHGSDGVSDIMDSIRYPMQVLFNHKKTVDIQMNDRGVEISSAKVPETKDEFKAWEKAMEHEARRRLFGDEIANKLNNNHKIKVIV